MRNACVIVNICEYAVEREKEKENKKEKKRKGGTYGDGGNRWTDGRRVG
jgi:hypothetical protein